MQHLCQRNPIWGAVKIGQSDFTVAAKGCTITCISMITDRFGECIYPDSIALKQSFTDRKYKDGPGLILWTKLNLPDTSFIKRGYGRNDVMIIDVIKNPNRAIILEVQHSHWVLCVGKSLLGGYNIIDPWTGNPSTTRFYNDDITGYAIFERKSNKK